MRSAFFVYGFLVFVFSVAAAQDPVSEARRRMSERRTGNTGTVVTPTPPRAQPIISYVTYLSKEREWADVTGRKMSGRLVAFSAPAPGKTGPVIVLHEGKVRLRRTGAKLSNDLAIEKLSEEDQEFVKAIEASIKRAAEAAKKQESQVPK